MINGAAERFSTESGVSGIKVGQEICRIKGRADARVVVAAGVGVVEIEVGRFVEVVVQAKMVYNAGVLAVVGGKNIVGVAAINLGSSLEELVFWGGQKPR